MTFALNRVVIGDCRETLRAVPDETFQACVTSPPYWGLRDYGHPDQLGLESTPAEYVAHMVDVFREVRRTLRDDGTLWLNLGDSYAATRPYQVPSTKGGPKIGPAQAVAGRGSTVPDGLKPKDLIGIPWRVAFALQADGWYLRSDVIWHKPNPMPESVTDRPTKAHEYVFLLSKSTTYFYDADAIAERATYAGDVVSLGAKSLSRGQATGIGIKPHGNGAADTITVKDTRNARTVWTIGSEPYAEAHFATMPTALAKRCILAGSPVGGAVLDPFLGSGTVGQVAEQLGRQWFGCEPNPDYGKLIATRTAQIGIGL